MKGLSTGRYETSSVTQQEGAVLPGTGAAWPADARVPALEAWKTHQAHGHARNPDGEA